MYICATHSICNLKYTVTTEISKVFDNTSNYDYDFIIKQLAEKFENQFSCLVENTEKCTTCSFPVEKEVTRIDKKGNEITKTTAYKLQLIDTTRLLKCSL